MQAESGIDLLQAAARALARGTDLQPTLDAILGALTAHLEVASAAVFEADDAGSLRLAAWIGFADPDGLAAAVQRPGHPIAVAFRETASAFDVRPVAPGGPALRGHVPLVVGRGGTDAAVGVLAIAYDDPIGPVDRLVVEAAADLLAVAIDRDRR